MAMYANVGGASKLLAQTSAEAGGGVIVTEVITDSYTEYGITRYRKKLYFPSDCQYADITVCGYSHAGINFGCLHGNNNSESPYTYINTIDFTATAFDNFKTSSSQSYVTSNNNLAITLINTSTDFVISAKIIPDHANDSMKLVGLAYSEYNITSFAIEPKETIDGIFVLDTTESRLDTITLRAICYSS